VVTIEGPPSQLIQLRGPYDRIPSPLCVEELALGGLRQPFPTTLALSNERAASFAAPIFVSQSRRHEDQRLNRSRV
jgi:hypothetical protein